MILFSKDAINCIHRAALDSINKFDEVHYLFLKKFSQVSYTLLTPILTKSSERCEEDSVAIKKNEAI